MVIISEFDCNDNGNSSDSSMAQALVPLVNNNQWQDQMDGKSRTVFQQPEIGSHVSPYASIQELQPCLATHGGYVRMEDTMQNAPQDKKVESPQSLPFEEFQRRLTQHLKVMVFQAVGELKQESQVQKETQNTNEVITDATPISFRKPDENDRKLRGKANLVAEIRRSFILPTQLSAGHGVDLDKLPVPAPLLEQMKPDVENKKRFTFFERLENWKLLCKQRVNGKFDTYYRHEASEEIFRSVVEVVNYMLYAICPRHLQKTTKGTPIEDSSSQGTKARKRNRSTLQISSGDDPEPEEGIKTKSQLEEDVEAFLKDAYNNLLNLYPNKNCGESSSNVNNKPQRIQ